MKKAMRGLLALVLVITSVCSYGCERVYARTKNLYKSEFKKIYRSDDFYGKIDLEVDAGQEKGFNLGYYVYASGKDCFEYRSHVDEGLDSLTYTGTFTVSGIGLSSTELSGDSSVSITGTKDTLSDVEVIESFYGENERHVEYIAYGAVIIRFSHTMKISYKDAETAYGNYGVNNPKAGNFSYGVDMTVW